MKNSENKPNTSYIPGPWVAAAQGAGLLTDGAPQPTIFETMTMASQQNGAINLGQGFPDADGPDWIRNIAARAVASGTGSAHQRANQYAPGTGMPVLREALAHHSQRVYGLHWDPGTEILITTGATEGLAATLLALLSPGDQVITCEPFYDEYGAIIGLAGAENVTIPLQAPDFIPDVDRLEAAITPSTRALILNTPHNPTGVSLSGDQIQQIMQVCARHGVWVITDEVYEHLVFEGVHSPVAAHGQGYDRVVSVSSAGKMLSLTGWKVGWVMASAPVIQAIRAVKQFLTYSSGPAYQLAVAEALTRDQELDAFLEHQRSALRSQRDGLIAALRQAGLDPLVPDAGYFTIVDLAPAGFTDGQQAAFQLVESLGVAGIPVSAFCSADANSTVAHDLGTWMRFAFCKSPAVMAEGIARVGRLGSSDEK